MAAITIPLYAGEETRQDLAQLVERAMVKNPALLAVETESSVVENQIVEARAEAFPQLDLVSSWNQSRNPALLNSPDFADIIDQFPSFQPSTQELYTVSVEANQTLYSGGRIRAALSAARLGRERAEARIKESRLDVALQVADVYYALLAAEKALESVETQITARERGLEVVQARFDLGDATRLELLRAQSSREELRPVEVDLKGAVDVLRTELKSIVSWPVDSPLNLEPMDRGLPKLPELDVVLELAARYRPELRLNRIEDELLETRKVITLADGKPQVEFNGAWGRQVRLVENFDDPLFADWRFSVGVSWSFFDGGRRRGQAAQLDGERRKLDFELSNLQRLIQLDVEKGYTAYRTALSRFQAAELLAKTAGEAGRVALESYQEGVALQADWLDAQDEASRGELAEIQAYYQAWREAARLARSVGFRPDEALDALDRSQETDEMEMDNE